jgi:hypothetical protein
MRVFKPLQNASPFHKTSRIVLTWCSPTIVMNVIRMIKLFGWETKVKAQVEEKREEELHYYKKKQFVGQVSANVK